MPMSVDPPLPLPMLPDAAGPYNSASVSSTTGGSTSCGSGHNSWGTANNTGSSINSYSMDGFPNLSYPGGHRGDQMARYSGNWSGNEHSVFPASTSRWHCNGSPSPHHYEQHHHTNRSTTAAAYHSNLSYGNISFGSYNLTPSPGLTPNGLQHQHNNGGYCNNSGSITPTAVAQGSYSYGYQAQGYGNSSNVTSGRSYYNNYVNNGPQQNNSRIADGEFTASAAKRQRMNYDGAGGSY